MSISCGFDLHFPKMLSTFSWLYEVFLYLLWRYVYLNSSFLIGWLFCMDCKGYLCILDTQCCIADKRFANIFTHSVVSFTFLVISFAVQKFLILMKLNQPLVSFFACALVSSITQPMPRSQNYTCVYCFINLALLFGSMIHFVIFFVRL